MYNDSSVVVRELVQNAIDAVKLQNQYEIKKGTEVTKVLSVLWVFTYFMNLL